MWLRAQQTTIKQQKRLLLLLRCSEQLLLKHLAGSSKPVRYKARSF